MLGVGFECRIVHRSIADLDIDRRGSWCIYSNRVFIFGCLIKRTQHCFMKEWLLYRTHPNLKTVRLKSIIRF